MSEITSSIVSEVAIKHEKPVDDVLRSVELARQSLVPKTKPFTVTEFGCSREIAVTRDGVGPLVTHLGKFHHFAFSLDDKWQKYSVLMMCAIDEHFNPVFKNRHELLLRIDSGCETGQLFGDLTCDCRDQLFLSMRHIRDLGEGMIINIPRQDGRGRPPCREV